MKKTVAMVLAVLALALCPVMQAYADEPNETTGTSNNSEANETSETPDELPLDKKIEQLFAGEADMGLRLIETDAFKAAVSEDFIGSKDSYVPLVQVGSDRRYLYLMRGIGLYDKTFMYSPVGDDYIVYSRCYSEEDMERNVNDINSIYDFVESVVSKTGGMTEEEKLEFLNQAVVDRIEYNYGGQTHRVNEALNTNRATCLGYANLFYLLCINSGIRCECVGNSTHAFNRVWQTSVGDWRYIDTCWNDTSGVVKKYFLMTEDDLNSLEFHTMHDYFVTEHKTDETAVPREFSQGPGFEN